MVAISKWLGTDVYHLLSDGVALDDTSPFTPRIQVAANDDMQKLVSEVCVLFTRGRELSPEVTHF